MDDALVVYYGTLERAKGVLGTSLDLTVFAREAVADSADYLSAGKGAADLALHLRSLVVCLDELARQTAALRDLAERAVAGRPVVFTDAIVDSAGGEFEVAEVTGSPLPCR